MFGVAGHPEFLPYEKSHFIAKLEEIVRFGNAAAPHADKVDTGLLGVSQFRIRAFVGGTEHPFRNPVGSPDEQFLAVYVELAGFVRCILVGSNFADTETGFCFVGNLAVDGYGQLEFVQFRFPFEKRPPQARVLNRELRELFRCKTNFLCFPSEQIQVFAECYILADDFPFDRTFDTPLCRVRHFYADSLFCQVVVWFGKFGFDERMADNRFVRSIEADVFPDTGIPVADTVIESKIPTDTHQHGCVQSDVTVSTIVKLAGGSPLLRLDGSRHIYRIYFDRQGIFLADTGEIRDIDILRFEHAGHIAKQITVHPYLGTVVDTVYLEPDDFVFIVFRHVEFRPEPVGIKIASYFSKVRDNILVQFIVHPVIGFGINLVVYQ